MANPDFAGILNRQSGEVERPKPLPIGEYVWKIKGLPNYDKSAKKGTPYVEFVCVPLSATDSVDADDLQESLTRKTGVKQLSDMVQKITFYLTEDALWRLKEFLTNDLQIEEGEKTLQAMIEEAPNSEFIGTIKHTPTNDGKGVFASIGSTAPTE
jgi:hypothetical protein